MNLLEKTIAPGLFSSRTKPVMLAKAGIQSLECEDGFLSPQE